MTRPTTGPGVLSIAGLKLSRREKDSEPVPTETGMFLFVSAAAAVRRSLNLVAKAQASIVLETQTYKARREPHDPLKPRPVND